MTGYDIEDQKGMEFQNICGLSSYFQASKDLQHSTKLLIIPL